MPLWNSGDLEREAWRRQTNENSARLAYAWGVSTSTGVGDLSHEDAVEFGITFLEKPMFSYGCVLVGRTDWEDDEGGADVAMPTSTGFVYDWRIDGRGFYTGALVGVTVLAGDTAVSLEHHFTFMGVAIKDLDADANLA